jgi:hypothetical protein
MRMRMTMRLRMMVSIKNEMRMEIQKRSGRRMGGMNEKRE